MFKLQYAAEFNLSWIALSCHCKMYLKIKNTKIFETALARKVKWKQNAWKYRIKMLTPISSSAYNVVKFFAYKNNWVILLEKNIPSYWIRPWQWKRWNLITRDKIIERRRLDKKTKFNSKRWFYSMKFVNLKRMQG